MIRHELAQPQQAVGDRCQVGGRFPADALQQLTAPRLPQLVVLSDEELSGDTLVESVGMVGETLPVAA